MCTPPRTPFLTLVEISCHRAVHRVPREGEHVTQEAVPPPRKAAEAEMADTTRHESFRNGEIMPYGERRETKRTRKGKRQDQKGREGERERERGKGRVGWAY